MGNALADLDPDRLPPHQKRQGPDWFAVFNPRIPRVLDVDLVHNLPHESVVCCVRFSQDGRYVATGCNRSAQIFDVQSGKQVSYLQDDSVDKDGDLYIRSVCFSPDGKYLATGAEDKQIRVCGTAHLSFAYCTQFRCANLFIYRSGKSQHVLLGTLSPAMSKTSIPLISPAMVNTLPPVAAIVRCAFGILRLDERY